jgi:hypothetical protein
VNQPPAYANKPAIPAINTPIAANRRTKLALDNSAMGVRAFMAFLLFKECARTALHTTPRRLSPKKIGPNR